LHIPVYFYEAAALRPERVKLEKVRSGQFAAMKRTALWRDEKMPDIGGPGLHPTAGAVIVGARKILIAYNINLETDDINIAQTIAKRIRESSGGFRGIKALGLTLASQGIVQVSMNITDFEATPIHVVFLEVQRLAAECGVAIRNSELIGLLPRQALEMTTAAFLKLDDFDGQRVVETRLETVLAERDSIC
jgi:glutamate formiminotransferase